MNSLGVSCDAVLEEGRFFGNNALKHFTGKLASKL